MCMRIRDAESIYLYVFLMIIARWCRSLAMTTIVLSPGLFPREPAPYDEWLIYIYKSDW